MKNALLATLLLAACYVASCASAASPSLDVPPVFLSDLSLPIAVNDPGQAPLSVFVDGNKVFEGLAGEGEVIAEVTLAQTGETNIELFQDGIALEQIGRAHV